MKLTLKKVMDSMAGFLDIYFPGIPVYSNPDQQGLEAPYYCVLFTSADIRSETGNQVSRDIETDVVYTTVRDIPDAYEQMYSIADTLDLYLEFIPYNDRLETEKIKVYDKKWMIEEGRLHYQFTLKT